MLLTRAEFIRGAIAMGALLALRKPALAQESIESLLPPRVLGGAAPAPGERGAVVTALAMHPTEKRLASAGDDHEVRLWDLDQGSVLRSLAGHTDWVRAVAYSPDGLTLVSAGNDRKLIAWEADSGDLQRTIDLPLSGIAGMEFHPGGGTLAVVGFQAEVLLLDAQTMEVAAKLPTPSTDVRAVRFSREGRFLAAGGRDGVVRSGDLTQKSAPVDMSGHRGRVRGLTFADDTSAIFSAGEDGSLRMAKTGVAGPSELFAAVGCKLQSLCRVGDRFLAAGGSDNLIHLWDMGTREEIEPLAGHTGSVAALCCGTATLASGGFDAAVRLWDLADVLPEGAAKAVAVPGFGTGPAFSTSAAPAELGK
jgi:WD40 repeat protein